MPTIGLTTFVDFMSAKGLSRVRVVEAARRDDNQPYDPRKDFYKRLRDASVSYAQGRMETEDFRRMPMTLPDRKKHTNFPPAIEAMIAWRTRNPGSSHSSVRGEYSAGALRVTVNPELCIDTQDGTVAAKLWFKTDPIPKARINYILATIRFGLRSFRGDVGIIDVRRQTIHLAGQIEPQMQILLRGEASAFMAIWDALGET